MTDVFAGAEGLDSTAPQVQNQNPAPGAIDVALASNVYLEIVDDPAGTGVDLGSVDIVIEGVNAIIGGVVQAGFAATITPITDGYSFDINPDTDFLGSTVIDVQVDAADLNLTPNVMPTVNYSFSTDIGDLLAPVLENQSPAPGETDVAADTSIVLDVIDPPSTPTFGVDFSTINVQVQGENAVVNGAVSPGWTGTVQPEGNGYRISLTPPADFSLYELVTVDVQAADLVAGNALDTSYSFRITEGLIEPPVLNAQAGNAQVRLVWSVGEGSMVQSWLLKRSTSSFPLTPIEGQTVFQGGNQVFVDTDVENGTLYYYTIFLIRRLDGFGEPVYAPYGEESSARAKPIAVVVAEVSRTEYVPQRGELGIKSNPLPGARVSEDLRDVINYNVDIGSIVRAPVAGTLSVDTLERGSRLSVQRGDIVYRFSPVRLLAPVGPVEAGVLIGRAIGNSITVTVDKLPGRFIRPTYAVVPVEKRDG